MRRTQRGLRRAHQAVSEGHMSIRGWARSRAIPVSTVAKAIRDGRIDRLPSGKIDPGAADRAWVERTRLRIDSRTPGAGAPGAAGGHGPHAKFNAARAKHETYRAQKAKLEFERMRGKLIDAEEVRLRWFTICRRTRDNLMTVADRVAPMVTGMTDGAEVHRIIASEIRQALEELAGDPT